MITDNKYNPAIGSVGGKYRVEDLNPGAATNGQVLVYNSTTGVWEPGNAVASALTSAHIFVGDGSAIAQDVAVSGDLTLANTGAFTIANNAVSTAKIADNAVTGDKIALASEADGDIMYRSSGVWVRLAKGTAGQVLTMNGGATAPVWA